MRVDWRRAGPVMRGLVKPRENLRLEKVRPGRRPLTSCNSRVKENNDVQGRLLHFPVTCSTRNRQEGREKTPTGEEKLDEKITTVFAARWGGGSQKSLTSKEESSTAGSRRNQKGQVRILSEAEQDPGRTSPYPLRSRARSRRQRKEAATTSRQRRTKSYNLFKRDSRKSRFTSIAEREFMMEKFTRRTSQRSASLEILSDDSTGSL
ncbi:hypothetical protein TNCV_1590921 [Trichonephila clavipes]|nr:hypothetical protein TNCV_1590921 [Trichonephila clavipes]